MIHIHTHRVFFSAILMTPAEAHAAAAAEGLALLLAENATGFKHVSRDDRKSKPFQATLKRGDAAPVCAQLGLSEASYALQPPEP